MEEVSTTRGSGWVRSYEATFNHLVRPCCVYFAVTAPTCFRATHPPATAGGTDLIQVRLLTFEARPREAFPNMEIVIEDMVAEGDRVAARCSVRAKHEGDFMGLAATQTPVEFTGMTIVRIDNGKIVEAWNNFDFTTLHKQVGLI